MFGSYDAPLGIEKEGISLSVERAGEIMTYRRQCGDEKVEKMLLTSTGTILINPVEPVNKPKEITSSLLIEFKTSLVVEPAATKKIYVTYPVEIGVFIAMDKKYEVLDIFSIQKQKFTLYGDPRSGVICKYGKSEVYSSIPSVNPLLDGVIELSITNTVSEWVNVTKAIFNAYGMKLYYSDDMVYMKATMKINNEKTAETGFVDSPLERGMKKSLELYTVRKLAVVSTKFVMEGGI
jgi:hypothetical protein